MEQYIVGFIFLVFGGMNVVRPDLMVRFQVWSQLVVMGAEYIPSERTHTVIRIFGVLFVFLGLGILTGALA